jgi:citrate synthase
MKRVQAIVGHLDGRRAEEEQKEGVLVAAPVAGQNTLSVTDNRDGKTYQWPIENGTIHSKYFGWGKVPGPRVRPYDPGYTATASAKSKITWINGPKGILEYRGYPIEQLAEKSNFLEVSYLLLYGELPTPKQYKYFSGRVMKHTYVHNNLKTMMKSFRYDAHPMGMVISTVAAMSTFHPEANPALAGEKVYKNTQLQNKQIHRIMGTMPTIAAFAYRHRVGRPYVDPSSSGLGYTENFLYMLDKLSQRDYKPHPKLAKALDILFILHADHELNCSTSGVRHATSSGVDVYTAIASGASSLYGPRHGGANEAVLRMLERIGNKANIPAFIERVKNREERLMGFGHRVYRNYDPRAKLVRKVANQVFEILGREPLIEIATELERIALSDDFFVSRKLYPNVDFYSGLIYKAMGFPTDFFPVLFTIPRTVGWLSHWKEFLADKDNRIVRPRQVYLGHSRRNYVPMNQRGESASAQLNESYRTSESKRREAANL